LKGLKTCTMACRMLTQSLPTRELARMIKEAGIDFVNLPDEEFDQPLGMSTGAAVILVPLVVSWKQLENRKRNC